MSDQKQHKVWQVPWGYTESIAIVIGVTIIGLILQLTIGSFNFFTLAKPVNIITGLAIFALSVAIGALSNKSNFARWMKSKALSVSLIVAILALTIIMGLTPQIAEGAENYTALGFDSMTRNWSFVMLYGLTLISLGATIVNRLIHFKISHTPFILQHLGLWLLLMASGLGYADMERYIMYVNEGETQWRVYSDDKEVRELPIAIKLHDFDMEVYPPKLAVIDRESGAVQPEGAAQYMQIDQDITKGKLNGWLVYIEEYIHKAVRDADSAYREVPMPGATPAAKITATKAGKVAQGWISAGNQMQFNMSLPLNDKQSIVMTPAEPRKFVSSIEVYTSDGQSAEKEIEVNKPLRIGAWTIYQYGYDNAAGALSSYSSFELVYDPWLIEVYIGIALLMLGALCMIIQGRNRKEGKL